MANYRWSKLHNDMLMKVFQVVDDWDRNKGEYDGPMEAAVDKFNIAYDRTDGEKVYWEVSQRAHKSQVAQSAAMT